MKVDGAIRYVVRTQNQYYGIGKTITEAWENTMKAGAPRRDRLMVSKVTGDDAPKVDGMGSILYFGECVRLFNKPMTFTAIQKLNPEGLT